MSSNPPSREDELAELLAAVLAGRPERVLETALAFEPPEVQAGFAMVNETLASVGAGLAPESPRAELRDRVLATLNAKRARASATKGRALIVVDMIREHLDVGGPLEVPRARAIVPALKARIEAARADGVPVVYVVDEHDPEDADLDGVAGWGAHAIRGSEGTDVWPELAPAPGDVVVKKATYSAFTGSDLAKVLDEKKIDSIVLTGCLTELGLMATATDALQRGFAVEVPPDSQAGANEVVEKVALGVLAIMPPYGAARRKRLEALR